MVEPVDIGRDGPRLVVRLQSHVGVVFLLFQFGRNTSAEHVVVHQIVTVRHLEAAVVSATKLEDVVARVIWRDDILGFVTALVGSAI